MSDLQYRLLERRALNGDRDAQLALARLCGRQGRVEFVRSLWDLGRILWVLARQRYVIRGGPSRAGSAEPRWWRIYPRASYEERVGLIPRNRRGVATGYGGENRALRRLLRHQHWTWGRLTRGFPRPRQSEHPVVGDSAENHCCDLEDMLRWISEYGLVVVDASEVSTISDQASDLRRQGQQVTNQVRLIVLDHLGAQAERKKHRRVCSATKAARTRSDTREAALLAEREEACGEVGHGASYKISILNRKLTRLAAKYEDNETKKKDEEEIVAGLDAKIVAIGEKHEKLTAEHDKVESRIDALNTYGTNIAEEEE